MSSFRGRSFDPDTPVKKVNPLIALLLGLVALVVVVFGAYIVLGFITGWKSCDPGKVCVVREGGWFDGRNIKEVRKPGSGLKFVGIWNSQTDLPVTERDSNDVIPDQDPNTEGFQPPVFQTIDSVQVRAEGQALYQLTQDQDLIRQFYTDFGRRTWGGEDLSSDEGFLNFQQQRIAPVILDAQREVIGASECVPLNNLCKYVQNPEEAASGEEAENVDNTQNLSAAQRELSEKIKEKLNQAFGADYFENVRYQNFRVTFEPEVQQRITEAQSLRTQAANARLEAERKKAEARGEADRVIEQAIGAKKSAREQAKAYRVNPTAREIDKIKAFCGPDGCDPQVIGGGGISDIISSLGSR